MQNYSKYTIESKEISLTVSPTRFGYKFRGCIVNPAVKEPVYTNGIYRCDYNMNIRKKPNGEHVKVKECTDAMKKALTSKSPNANAVIKKDDIIKILEQINNANRIPKIFI